MKVERPILRWHGGKWMLAPWIISFFPGHRTYCEPYGGAASVLLQKPRSYGECYNDLDGEVVNVFRVMRDDSEELRRRLALTPFARDEFSSAYKPVKEPIERARRMIARSFMGFGSDGSQAWRKTGFRAWSNRSGTTPAHDWANYPDNIAAFTDRLRGVVIENRPASEILVQQDGPETLFYLDPPYVFSTRAKGSARQVKRYRHEMTDEDHQSLRANLDALKGMVIVSGYRCPLYDDIYGNWERHDIASRADGASPRTESLWLSPRTASTLHPRLFA